MGEVKKVGQNRKTAVHEAGHVVANIHFGLRFEDVTLSRDGSGEVQLRDVRYPESPSEADAYTIALFSGYAAEHVLLGEGLRVEGVDWDLYLQDVMPLFRRRRRFAAFTRRMLAKAVKLTEFHCSEIRAVADALYARRHLTEKEALRICNSPSRAWQVRKERKAHGNVSS